MGILWANEAAEHLISSYDFVSEKKTEAVNAVNRDIERQRQRDRDRDRDRERERERERELELENFILQGL